MTKVFIFNGPPGSGKDEICDHLNLTFPKSIKASFKEELYDDTVQYFGVDYGWFMDGYTRETKETPEPSLGNRSRREALIYVSETIRKPAFGKSYYGDLLSHNISETHPYAEAVFISDGGFVEEIQAVVDTFGADDVVIVQLHREGKNFDKDSRKYVTKTIHEDVVIGYKLPVGNDQFSDSEVSGPRTIKVSNNGSLAALFLVTENIVKEELCRGKGTIRNSVD